MAKNNYLNELRQYLLPKIISCCLVILISFLTAHIIFLTIFTYYHVDILMYMNLGSVAVYSALLVVMFLRDKFGKDFLMTLISNCLFVIIAELIIHMIGATICLGWDYAFYSYSFGIVVLILFDNYIIGNNIRSVLLFCTVVLAYGVLRVYTWFYSPIYAIDNELVVNSFQLVNGCLVLIFDALCIAWLSHCIFKFETRLVKNASYDRLTGLANRRYIDKLKYSKLDSCVAILDIDNFKHINDTYGHGIGDEVLKDLGKLLKDYEKSSENLHAIRWGGEEFVLIFENDINLRDVFINILDELRVKIYNSEVITDVGIIRYHITVGVAFADEAENYKDLVSLADSRLYRGKQTGKNKVIFND